ncbi:MAG: hypothetical protein HZB23_11005 [Deltaproteobacteria bacterium]|nr:hypothetical protein [Deltaproteobacteria bacterium]
MAAKQILLVEGKDDEYVVKHLCGNLQGPHIEKIKDCEGIDNLLEALPVRLKSAQEGQVGVVVDADANLAARWQSIRNILVTNGYISVPVNPSPDGTVVEPTEDSLLPRFGVWIMPDNRTNGILEDFLRVLVPEGSPLFAHAEASIDGIPQGERKFSDPKRPKALIHTWLAWQEEPGKPLGTSITAKYLDPNTPSAAVFVSWLNRLFS